MEGPLRAIPAHCLPILHELLPTSTSVGAVKPGLPAPEFISRFNAPTISARGRAVVLPGVPGTKEIVPPLKLGLYLIMFGRLCCNASNVPAGGGSQSVLPEFSGLLKTSLTLLLSALVLVRFSHVGLPTWLAL